MSKPEKSWFRAYADMVDDEKLRLLAFEDRWHFVALLCCKRAGLLDNGDPHDLLCRKVAVKLGLQLRELEAVSARLAEVGLINPGTFQPLAWAERQFESDISTDRVRQYRERKRLMDEGRQNETATKRFNSVSETAPETDTETDTETEAEKAKAGARRTRAPVELPDWLPAEVWQEWHDFRNQRKGWTPRARQLSLGTLARLRSEGHDPRAVIEQSIERGWTGLFPIRSNQPHGPPSRPSVAQQFAQKTYTGTPDDDLPEFLRTGTH